MPPARRSRRQAQTAPAVADAPVVPFTSAAHENTVPAFDVTITPGATQQQIGPFDIPAAGYMRHLSLQVDATGGTLGAGALSADYPFNLFNSLQVSDVNGGNLAGPLDGYAMLWADILGGYFGGRVDPRSLPNYIGTINASYFLRMPAEISHRDGFGALANQSAAAQYRFFATINPSTILYSTAPTTIPAFRVRGTLEAWTLPAVQDLAGRRQADMPPMLGTTQYLSYFTRNTGVGANTIQLPRQGNLIRFICIIARTAGGARQDNVFADPVVLEWDGRSIHNMTQQELIRMIAEKAPDLTARDTGVFAFPFTHSDANKLGDDSPALWLPTVQSTSMILKGNAVTAGTWQIITCDVAPAEVRPEERYREVSATGLHPAIGIAAPAAQ